MALVTDVNSGADIMNCPVPSCFVHLLTCIIRSMKLISLVKHFFESDSSLQYSL